MTKNTTNLLSDWWYPYTLFWWTMNGAVAFHLAQPLKKLNRGIGFPHQTEDQRGCLRLAQPKVAGQHVRQHLRCMTGTGITGLLDMIVINQYVGV